MGKKIITPDAYTPETVTAVAAIVAEAENCKSAYFWTPSPTAGGRRANEHRRSHACASWTEGGHAYTAAYSYRESCNNCYASGYYTRDGKITTLTAVRNSLRRMEAAQSRGKTV